MRDTDLDHVRPRRLVVTTRLGVTTTRRVDAGRTLQARAGAERLGLEFLERKDRTYPEILGEGFDALVVFEPLGVRLVDAHASVGCHAGMAFRRVARIRQGYADPMLELAGVRRGHRVLDATLGFGQDALVAAAVVGPSGRVVGLEASEVLAAFAALGLPECRLPARRRPEPAAPIDVRCAEAVDWLERGVERRFGRGPEAAGGAREGSLGEREGPGDAREAAGRARKGSLGEREVPGAFSEGSLSERERLGAREGSSGERFDVALLDPMFAAPKQGQPAFEVLRRYARDIPLDDRLLDAALARADTVVAKLGNPLALDALSRRPVGIRRTHAFTLARFTRDS